MATDPNAQTYSDARDAGIARAKAALSAGADGAYTVQPGDTIASIAEAIYGDADTADDLAFANAAVIGTSSADPAPGTRLAIPYR